MRLALIGRRPSGRWLPTATIAVITAFVATPIAVVVANVGAETGGHWAHLASTWLPVYVRNTLLLAVGVAALTTVIGVSTAWLVTLCRFPGRRLLAWALLLPLAIPTYLGAYAYTDLLQVAGPVQRALREATGWSYGDYWFPAVRSLGGAVVILALALYPYVYLAARAAFVEQSTCALEVGRTLGLGPWRNFFRVALPLARPSIAAGLSLVLMETLAEFGAVDYCAVDTFATGIYRAFQQRHAYHLVTAAQLSACLLALILLLLALEASARRSARFHGTTGRYRTLPSWPLRGWRAVGATLVCAMPVLLGFGVPFVVFAVGSWRGGDARARELMVEYGWHSLVLATVASVLAVLLALAVSFCRRIDPSPLNRALARLASVGYAIPGTVMAIGILAPVVWIEQEVGPQIGDWLGTSPGLFLSGTIFAVSYGYQTRFLAVSANLLQAGFGRLRPSLDDAARSLGTSPLGVLGRVHWPMLRGSVAAAALLVFVDVVKELPATLILTPGNFRTLAVRVYQLAADERLDEASTGALAIIVIGLLPVILLSRVLDGHRQHTLATEEAVE